MTSRQYRLVTVTPGGSRNPYLWISSLDGLAMQARDFLGLKERGYFVRGITAVIETREHGPAPAREIPMPEGAERA